MKAELLRVLQVMSEVTHRMDLNEFAQSVGLSPDETLQTIQDLAKTGYLKNSGGGFGITAKGKAVLKAQTPVSEDLEFKFYIEIGQPLGLSVKSLKEFYEALKTLETASLEFHLSRGDFANWVAAVLKDEALAIDLEAARQSQLQGESLRRRLISVIEKHVEAEALR